MSSKLLNAIVKATGTDPDDGEDRQEFLVRLTKAANELSEAAWAKLPEDAQDWINDAVTAIKTKSLVVDPDVEEPEDEEEPAPKKAKAKKAKAEPEDDEDDEVDEAQAEADEDEPEDDEDEEEPAPKKAKAKKAKAEPEDDEDEPAPKKAKAKAKAEKEPAPKKAKAKAEPEDDEDEPAPKKAKKAKVKAEPEDDEEEPAPKKAKAKKEPKVLSADRAKLRADAEKFRVAYVKALVAGKNPKPRELLAKLGVDVAQHYVSGITYAVRSTIKVLRKAGLLQ